MSECPICGLAGAEVEKDMKGKVDTRVDCKSCGMYIVNLADLANVGGKKHLLSGELWHNRIAVQKSKKKERRLVLTEDVIAKLIDFVQKPAPLEAIDKILLYMMNEVPYPGHVMEFTNYDYHLVYALEIKEFLYYLDLATELNYLKMKGGSLKYQIKPDGWKRLDELRRNVRTTNQAYVALWFDKKTEDVWENGVKPALEETGYVPVRVDIKKHSNKICDEIIAEIRKSKIMVADFTGQRGRVYYEAGFAEGLGIPVIRTCRNDEFHKLHFDTRQHNHINWENAAELKKKLKHRIEATVPLYD